VKVKEQISYLNRKTLLSHTVVVIDQDLLETEESSHLACWCWLGVPALSTSCRPPPHRHVLQYPSTQQWQLNEALPQFK